ncbi:hypothetical protein [Rhizobium sp. YK2]|uniref:hypothetical protein n=1 Tax=Rhizobium sp. YK2 TaxID=1860096 RepID=UPI00084CD98B|nr:hypothetical protein [Rhizobium sp. YK2]OEC93383.1 hypothetical protein A9Z06_09450 [Rhizobium sp. YK2]
MGGALKARGDVMAGVDPDAILAVVHILDFDFGGPHRAAAEAVLANALTNRSAAPAAFATLSTECERRMAARSGISIAGLRSELARGGVPMAAPSDYRPDVAALNRQTLEAARALQDFERVQVPDADITISRACATACIHAANAGSLVLVGDPGAGKSAVINETARQLAAQGSDVVLLAVDRLQVETNEGLSAKLGISHPLADVLANWPGTGPAYLVLDALDACRFGKSEALFKTVMGEVFALEGKRWRIVVSIRTFDLLVGTDFGRLFRGAPPEPDLTDQRFQAVRHIRVPEWSGAEFDELMTRIPALGIAIDSGGAKLAELARVPFNTRLLTDLLMEGVPPQQLRNLGSQVQLLEMYWNERVRPLGIEAEQCLGNTVKAMIDRAQMEATRLMAGAGSGDALDRLLHRGVLISVNGDREVAFRHHILFDYAASRTAVDLDARADSLLDRKGAGLLLAPALSFALQHLWEASAPGRNRFWQAVIHLADDSATDPIVRSVASRLACELPADAEDIAGLARLMAQPTEMQSALGAFRHIVGALSVRLEDEVEVPQAPWCSIAQSAVPFVADVVMALRTLIHILVDRVTNPDLRQRIGAAARAVMGYAFDAPGGDRLMAAAIGLVSKTFGTSVAASRPLIERLLDPVRMEEHAANDMYWLANDVADIAAHDPDLVVLIYDRVFTHTIKEDVPTNFGNSKILGFTSNRRQDFEMSRWALKETFPSFAIDRSACGLEDYFGLDRGDRTVDRDAGASNDAALLDQMADQFFFAAGGPEIRKDEEPRSPEEFAYRKRYLADNARTFRRVGDAGTPHTIYYLLQLLNFLSPGDPAMVFDLACHTLLHAGKLHGYQSEPLGADQFVTMIGRTIADHRELFDDPASRLALVEVLEVFVDAGWPAARRLLYRLPEALR